MAVTLMIIDDDADDRDLFSDAVAQIDNAIQCLQASGAEEALHLLKQRDVPTPDFIFLDLNMPRMSGAQCLQQLKASKATRHIPVVIYSTSKQKEDKESMRNLGAAYFLTKPSKMTDLIRALETIIRYKRTDIVVTKVHHHQ